MRRISGIILAGGKSRRMGEDKAFLGYEGTSFIEAAVQKLKPYCSEILISSDNPTISIPGTLRVSDEIKDIGPLGGLYSCLKRSSYDEALVIPIDTPFITPELIGHILEHSSGYEVTVVRHGERIHPLTGLFHKAVIPILEGEIKDKHYKILMFIYKTKYQLLDTPGFDEEVFMNINSRSEYDGIKQVKP